MGLTSQGLNPDEIKKYKLLMKKFPRKVRNKRAEIVQSVVGERSKTSKAIARKIRSQILTHRDFNK